jgi:hypothetical protein
MAIQVPSDNHYKSRACVILESVAPKSIRYSHRERAYIVSKRTAAVFEAKMKEMGL